MNFNQFLADVFAYHFEKKVKDCLEEFFNAWNKISEDNFKSKIENVGWVERGRAVCVHLAVRSLPAQIIVMRKMTCRCLLVSPHNFWRIANTLVGLVFLVKSSHKVLSHT